MATIQIKNVPEDVHTRLRHRAVDAHQSLQEYVLGLLIRVAREPTIEEVLARAAATTGGSRVTIDDINAAIRADRDSR